MEDYGNGNGNEVIKGVTTTGEVRYGEAGVGNNTGASAANYDPFANNATGNTVANNVAESTTENAARSKSLPTELGFWSKVKSFLFQEITIELTPRQKKIEREINEFLFQEINLFGKKKTKIG